MLKQQKRLQIIYYVLPKDSGLLSPDWTRSSYHHCYLKCILKQPNGLGKLHRFYFTEFKVLMTQ